MRDFLFMTGCPRSGTSALSLLLSSHPKIAMGVERFHHYVIPEFKLNKDLFEKERFFDFRSTDSHIDLEKQVGIKRSYDALEENYDACRYFGDKVPYLYDHYKELIDEFNTDNRLKIVVIVRNIFDVANSYQIRAINKNLKWQRDYQRAVADWNRTMRYTLDIIDEFKNITLVQYEDLYDEESVDKVEEMFNSIGLDMEQEVYDFYKLQMVQSANRDEKRRNNYVLETAHKRYICLNSKFHLYKKLIETASV